MVLIPENGWDLRPPLRARRVRIPESSRCTRGALHHRAKAPRPATDVGGRAVEVQVRVVPHALGGAPAREVDEAVNGVGARAPFNVDGGEGRNLPRRLCEPVPTSRATDLPRPSSRASAWTTAGSAKSPASGRFVPWGAPCRQRGRTSVTSDRGWPRPGRPRASEASARQGSRDDAGIRHRGAVLLHATQMVRPEHSAHGIADGALALTTTAIPSIMAASPRVTPPASTRPAWARKGAR